MAQCRECGNEFVQNRPFQVFCNDRCKGAFHRRKYRQQAVEEAEERRDARINGHGTPEERQRASEVVARFVNERRGRIVKRI
jgi:hypothetical protein